MKSASAEIMRTKEVESGRSLGRWIGGSANQRISKSGKTRLEKDEFVQGTTKFVCFELPNRARTCSEAE